MLILKVFFFQCFLCVTVSGFSCYISPVAVVNESCTVSDNTTLRPCYTLQQISSPYWTWTHNVSSMEIIFLPGVHVIMSQSLMLSNMTELEVYPWNEQNVVVKCRQRASWIFENIEKLRITSLYFKYCHLEVFNSMSQFTTINECVFAKSKYERAIKFSSGFHANNPPSHNISVCNCIFSSNQGGIYVTGLVARSLIYVADSIFVSNWRDFYLVIWRDGEEEVDGGAIYIKNEAVLMLERSQFINNTVAEHGGAISIRSDGSQTHQIISTVFQSNTAGWGGAIHANGLAIYNCTFVNNAANYSGGAISNFVRYTSLKVYGTTFENNHCDEDGGAIWFHMLQSSEDNFKVQGCKFTDNSAQMGGAAHFVIEQGFALVENSIFQGNFAEIGGALYIKPYDWAWNISSNMEIKFCFFNTNAANLLGGAIFVENLKDHIMALNFLNSSFTHNQAGDSGGAVCWSCVSLNCQANINGDFIAGGNSALNGGVMYAEGVDIRYTTDNNATIMFTENIAESKGGALFIVNSRNVWETKIIFAHNAVTSAEGKGGAIYVEDTESCSVDVCFLGFNNSDKTALLEFVNNSATHGPVLYGGLLDRCTLDDDNPTLHGIDYFKQISTYEPTPLALTSDQIRICLCNSESQIDCSTREINTTKMRGETIKLTAISVDQDENPGLSIIRAFYVEPLAELDVGEWRNTANRMCTNLSYHIFTVESSATLVLQLLDKCQDTPLSTITVHIQLTPCSRGFELHNNTCACDRRLAQYFDVCNIDTRSVQRKGPTWLRYDQHHFKLSTNCPLDYCQVSSPTISLLSPDQQCANHRSGVLCGACKDNYSITLGGSKCSRCTSSYAAIGLTVLFAVAGLALVALLLVCNMTISAGTLNGLILYANVVSISGLTSLHNCSLCPILRVFLAWLNLDWGLQTCFYSGMDTYHKTWLQLAFPLYIWCLVTAIILASHYSSKAMRVFGTNNIAILATLFILSYTKILKTITTALSVTQVLQSHPDNTTHQLTHYRVWTYDGNMEYLKGKHVALFVVALSLLFLFLPYTLLLIFGQCVRSMSVKRCLWVSRCVRSTAFVSIIDAYHAPYNKRHRYWTGLMLLTRCLLFLAFASSYGNTDPLLNNMYITTVVTSCMLIYKVFVRNIYKQVFTNVLEMHVLSCQLGNPVGYSDFP